MGNKIITHIHVNLVNPLGLLASFNMSAMTQNHKMTVKSVPIVKNNDCNIFQFNQFFQYWLLWLSSVHQYFGSLCQFVQHSR